MRRFFFLLLAILAAAMLMPIGIANRQPVSLNLDPFARTPSPLAVDIPLSLLMFLLLMLGLLLGGLATWLGQGKWRRTARHKSREAYQWKSEADRLTRDRDGVATNAAAPTAAGRMSSRTAKLSHGR